MIAYGVVVATILLSLQLESSAPKPAVVVVVGAAGEPEFGTQFGEWSERWRAATGAASAEFHLLGVEQVAEQNDRERLQQLLAKLADEENAPLWLVLIGHGTFDGRTARFNLRGPDVTADELHEWLKPVRRPLAVIQCASASAPFINRLSGENRVVITATRSGDEQNFARFGQYMAAEVADLSADLDKDGQVSLLEAYLTACRQVAEFYDQESRLATEHALLDDNGDGLGTPADWFRGIRAMQRAKDGAALDGTRAHQYLLIASERERSLPPGMRARRDELELNVAALRDEKPQLDEAAYYERLEKLMVELAQVYNQQQ